MTDRLVTGDHRGPSLEARHPGLCRCCGERYPEGTHITRSPDVGGWAVTDHLDLEGTNA